MSSSWSCVKQVSECAEPNAANRRTMEDAHCCIDNFAGVDGQALFAVFDGHGGNGIVKYLEDNFSDLLRKHLEGESSVQEPIDSLIAAFTDCDIRSAEAGINTSGSTVAAAIIRNEGNSRKLYCANVGDTRVVIAHQQNKPERLTYDHTATDAEEVKRIEKAGGFILRKRVLGILSVARAIGDHAMKKYIISKPHTTTIEIVDTDSFLIIACDGVWDVFTDEEAVEFVAEELAKKDSPFDKVAEKLAEAAIARGSQDNITALVIDL